MTISIVTHSTSACGRWGAAGWTTNEAPEQRDETSGISINSPGGLARCASRPITRSVANSKKLTMRMSGSSAYQCPAATGAGRALRDQDQGENGVHGRLASLVLRSRHMVQPDSLRNP